MRGSRLLRAVAVLVIAAAIIVATPPPARAFAIPPQIVFSVTVTSSDDTDDGTCDASHCSVREAINFTNTNPIFSLIKFNIPAAGLQQITLQAPLPPITDPVTLDGRTQPGWAGAPLILVDGSNAISTGLAINAASTTVAGLAIVRFTGRGLDLAGGATRLPEQLCRRHSERGWNRRPKRHRDLGRIVGKLHRRGPHEPGQRDLGQRKRGDRA